MADSGRKRIAIDFDGVIHDYDKWTGVKPEGPPVPGALEAVKRLEENYDIVIFTTRANHDDGPWLVHQWLVKHGFGWMQVIGKKVPCSLYIDDRGLRFNGDWQEVFDFIEKNPELKRWKK